MDWEKIYGKYYKMYMACVRLQMKISSECTPKELRKIIKLQKSLLDVKEMLEQKVADKGETEM